MSRFRPLFPYLALTLFTAIAAGPLARAEMTCSDDGPFHLFRAVELGALIRAGHFFPRWSPHMAQGYGYPFYNFYAPLSSYLVVALQGVGLEYPAALKLAFALGLWLAGVAAFLFVRDEWGERAGVIAGIAYLFAPYLAYDVLFRANLAESFAFVWPPLILWSLRRALQTPDARIGIWTLSERGVGSCLYAALILTHNIFALLVSPLFAGYLALVAWQNRSWKALWRGGLALALGAALTAYFWLPALAERGLVHSDRLLVPPIFTWYTNFITSGELLAAPRAEDPLLINPSPPRAMGLIPAVLCLPALLAFLTPKNTGGSPAKSLGSPQRAPSARRLTGKTQRAPRTQRLKHPFFRGATGDTKGGHIVFFALALVIYGLMTLPISTPVWRWIRPLELVQFPWRMLGPASLCAAVLIGAGVHFLEQQLARLTSSFLILLLFASNLSWWYPRYCPSYTTASVADLVAYEQATFTTGTTAKGEYLPRTASGVPPEADLAEALRRGEEPARLLIVQGEVSVTSPTPTDPLDATIALTAQSDATLVYRQFYYPGWRVRVDGQPGVIRLTPGEGLISFDLPPGAHTVHVYFGLTPLRAVAVSLSLLTLVGLIAYGRFASLIAYRAPSPTLSPGTPGKASGRHSAPLGVEAWELGVIFLLLVLKLALIDRLPNPVRRSDFDGGAVTRAQVPLRADFVGGVSLYGYDLSATQLPADGALDVALYVSMREATDRRYWPAFTLLDSDGLTWNDPDYLPPRWHREPPHTPLWPLDQYAQWARRLTPLPGTPPGEYQLWGEVFDLDSQQIASLLDEQGNAVAPRFSLGTLTLTRPREPIELQPPYRPAAPYPFGPLSLLGYDLSRGAAQAGDTVRLTTYWKSEARTTADHTAQVMLLDALGATVASYDEPPVKAYPTSQWRPGDQWRGQHLLRLPAALATGDYTLSLQVLGQAGRPAQALGSLHVTAPPRTYARPALQVESGASFGEVGVLEGYALKRDEESLTLTLTWRAASTPDLSYSVFVHLGDSAGRVWAQSDHAPADWTRPTTGWLPGEYISDTHLLALPPDLPPGQYTLWAGLYDPRTGLRLPAHGPGATEDNRVMLGEVILP